MKEKRVVAGKFRGVVVLLGLRDVFLVGCVVKSRNVFLCLVFLAALAIAGP